MCEVTRCGNTANVNKEKTFAKSENYGCQFDELILK